MLDHRPETKEWGTFHLKHDIADSKPFTAPLRIPRFAKFAYNRQSGFGAKGRAALRQQFDSTKRRQWVILGLPPDVLRRRAVRDKRSFVSASKPEGKWISAKSEHFLSSTR
jgi:hypothetical protein